MCGVVSAGPGGVGAPVGASTSRHGAREPAQKTLLLLEPQEGRRLGRGRSSKTCPREGSASLAIFSRGATYAGQAFRRPPLPQGKTWRSPRPGRKSVNTFIP